MEPEQTSSAVEVTRIGLAATSADGVRLRGVHLARPGPRHGTALVIAHGFTHHTRHPSTRRVLAALARHAPVIALDMRGHGRSAGRSTVGDREPLDLDAAVALAHECGYDRVATVGFSLGAAVALRQAAGGQHRPSAVVAVSGPARWYSRETLPMRRVHWLLEQPHGRMAARALGVRLDGGWEVVPPSPVEVVSQIDAPLLVVHFAADRYFSPVHARALAAAAGDRAQLWLEPGDGHGESGTSPALAARIAQWALAAAVNGGPGDGHADVRSTVGALAPAERRAAGSEVG